MRKNLISNLILALSVSALTISANEVAINADGTVVENTTPTAPAADATAMQPMPPAEDDTMPPAE